MERLVYLYDHSFEGMLHAVARAVKDGRQVQAIVPHGQYRPNLFDTVISLTSDSAQADSLLRYLQNLHPQAAGLALSAFLSEERGMELQLYAFVRLSLQYGAQALCYAGNPAVAHLKGLSRKVAHEAHRHKGLIRFRIMADDLQYAPFEPCCNVITLCARHFRRRLAGCRWLLHDLRRNIALYWDTIDLQMVAIDADFAAQVAALGEVPAENLAENELYYQQLWRSFHGAISNPGRYNPRLQRQGMPKRYWKYLTEI